jgi:hypothetical protein
MAGRCLIVANQTLGGWALDDAVLDCVRRGVEEFYVVVPMTSVRHETAIWTGGFALDAGGASPEQIRQTVAEDERRYAAELDQARDRAQRRLGLMVEKIEAMGGQGSGEVGVDDPLDATSAVLEREGSFDEIIVSTLPAGISRWLKWDLANRVARLTDIPVTTVEAPEG